MMKNLLFVLFVSIICSTSARADLIVNGGFETGALSPWTKTNNVSIASNSSHTGTYNALFSQVGSPSFDTLSQTISTGTGTFDLDFWLLYGSGTGQEFKVTFDNVTILDLTTQLVTGGGSYKHFTINGITTNSASTVLTFASQNPAFFMRLDDVHLNPSAVVPEPSSLALAGLGGIGLIVGAIRRRRTAV